MANCILAFPNHVDATYYPVSFYGGSWSSARPLTNMIDPILSKVARSSDASQASTQFIVDLGVERDVRVIGIPKHTISRPGRVKISASLDNFATTVLATDWIDAWKEVYNFGDLPFGHPSWYDLKTPPEEAQGYPMPFIYVTDSIVMARYWKIEIDDTLNPLGYVDISRLFIASGWQPSVNIAYGMQLGWETETSVEKTIGGGRFYDVYDPRRVARFSIDNLPVDEALSFPYEIMRKQGIDKQIFFVLDPDDTVHLHRRSFLATLRQMTPLEYPYYGINNATFELEEVIA